MKKIILLLIIAGSGYLGWENKEHFPALLGFYDRPDTANYIRKPSKEYALRSLDRRMMTIEDLLVQGSHTLVYVTSDNCAECAEVDRNVQTILRHRKDVAIRKLTIRDLTSPNADKHQVRFEQSLLEKHGILQPPFVQLYSPEGDITATDKPESESGERFLEFWANTEQKRNS